MELGELFMENSRVTFLSLFDKLFYLRRIEKWVKEEREADCEWERAALPYESEENSSVTRRALRYIDRSAI